MSRKNKYVGMAVLAVILAVSTTACKNRLSMDDLARLIDEDIQSVVSSIVVKQGNTVISNGTGVYNFGAVLDDDAGNYSKSSDVSFTVTNRGGVDSTLVVSGISLSAGSTDQFVLTTSGGTTLKYDQSLTFSIRFDPTTTGNLAATVSIASDDPDTGTYTFQTKGVGQEFVIEMVAVPAGTSFSMGYVGVTDAVPVHTVASISAFKMGKYEITYIEWIIVKTWGEANGYTFANPGVQGKDGSGTEQEPVTMVNWRDAIVWCNAASELKGLTPSYYTDTGLVNVYRDATDTVTSITIDRVNWAAAGYRLPTEAEWEYAARHDTPFTQGDRTSGDTVGGQEDTYAWYSINSSLTTHPVGGKSANSLGIHDMSGNVWEWCWDWYDTYTTLSPYIDADTRGPASGTVKVVRSGSYSNPNNLIVASSRAYVAPASQTNQYGFRIARIP